MAEAPLKCNSCKTSVINVQGTVRISCPKCGQQEIVRCERCRRLAAKYSCAGCGFEGPN